MPRNLCPYCDPLPASSLHLAEKFDMLFAFPFFSQNNHTFAVEFFRKLHALTHWLIFSLLLPRLFTEHVIDETWQSRIYNRSHVIIREARKRGLPIFALSFFGLRTHFLSLHALNQKIIFEELPTLRLDREYEHDLSNKETFKKMLARIAAPHTEGKTFYSIRDALAYAEKVGFPLVIKPQRGSLSRHTFCNVLSSKDLRAAFARAQKISRTILVERYQAGDVFRATIVNAKLIAVALRERPNVIGDGNHTIKKLLDIKNAVPERGNFTQKNTTLHKVPLTAGVENYLSQQDLTLESIPRQGQKIYLHEKVILACGADIHDVTDAVHFQTRTLLEDVARHCNAPLIGFDLIASDISRSYLDQPFALLEANTKPFIDMHHYPVSGAPRNVAGALLDYVLQT